MREFITKIKQTPNKYWLGIPFDPKTNDESLTGFYTDFCIARYTKVIKQQKERKSKKSKSKALET
jgi:hypothetical protein